MTQTQPLPSQPSRPPSPETKPGDDDALSHLYKMSTTAGLGSGDYVAVNGAAVATLLLGFASALVLLAEFLLVIPLACLVVAVVAWRQISGSNGTQTGKALVAIGALCALGFGGFVVAREATEGMRTREDRAAINTLIADIGTKIKAGDYQGLYARFSDRFKQGVPFAQFEQRLASIRKDEFYGSLTGTSWNGLAEFQRGDDGSRFAAAKADFVLEKTEKPLPVTVSLSKRGGADEWQIEAMPELFPPQRQPPQQRQ